MIFSADKPHRTKLLRLLILAFFAVFFLLFWIYGASADNKAADTLVDQNKWYWSPFGDSFSQRSFQLSRASSSENTLQQCWVSGIWLDDFVLNLKNLDEISAPILFQKAQCLQALGMENEAITAYRWLAGQNLSGTLFSEVLHGILEILRKQDNFSAVIVFYQNHRIGTWVLACTYSWRYP